MLTKMYGWEENDDNFLKRKGKYTFILNSDYGINTYHTPAYRCYGNSIDGFTTSKKILMYRWQQGDEKLFSCQAL